MKKVCLGKIIAAHGVKGLVKILPFGEDPWLLDGTVLLEDGRAIEITLKNPIGKYILAEVDGVVERNAAEGLRGQELFIERDALPETDDGSFYVDDLVGLDVVEDGVVIGKVIAADNFGAGDLLEIRLKNGKNFYLPFNDDTVPDVNIEEGFVTTADHERFILS